MRNAHKAALGGLVLGTLAISAGCSSGVFPGKSGSTSEPPNEYGPNVSEPEEMPAPASGPQPQFGRTVTLAESPPPISGGTLLVTDGGIAVAADPDRDQVYIVSLTDQTVKKVVLSKHDEPGRVAMDDAGRAHVVLRSGGAVATIDVASGTLLARRNVCPAPRGIAFDKNRTRLLVACADGQLATLPTSPEGVASRIKTLQRDLRDVVVLGDQIFVSQFRSSRFFMLSADATQQAEVAIAHDAGVEPTLAWRMIPPSIPGEIVVAGAAAQPILLHQLASRAPLSTDTGGYGGSGGDFDACSIHKSTTSSLRLSSGQSFHLPTSAVLPVDVAIGQRWYGIVAAGNGHSPGMPQLYLLPKDNLSVDPGTCSIPQPVPIAGQATSVAAYEDDFVVQSREPASLVFVNTGMVISLDETSREDTGHAIFHSNSGAGLACASCHGEGGDDGHVWSFLEIGARRTPSMHGTLAGTAPYHWNGEEADIGRLSDDVMTVRMSGPALASDQKSALQSWLFALPAPAKSGVLDEIAVARGKTLFDDSNVGCATCHSGPSFTNSATVDVGTGGAFQVPPLLGVGARAPFLHDGTALTLRDRFTVGGGDAHGHTSSLTEAQIGDLIAYLESL